MKRSGCVRLDTIAGVQREYERIYAELEAGTLEPGLATVLLRSLRSIHRTILAEIAPHRRPSRLRRRGRHFIR